MENQIDNCEQNLYKNEIQKYIELKHKFKSTFVNDNNIVYLINKEWLYQWKHKTNYYSIHPSRNKNKHIKNLQNEIQSIDNSILIRKVNSNSLFERFPRAKALLNLSNKIFDN